MQISIDTVVGLLKYVWVCSCEIPYKGYQHFIKNYIFFLLLLLDQRIDININTILFGVVIISNK